MGYAGKRTKLAPAENGDGDEDMEDEGFAGSAGIGSSIFSTAESMLQLMREHGADEFMEPLDDDAANQGGAKRSLDPMEAAGVTLQVSSGRSQA